MKTKRFTLIATLLLCCVMLYAGDFRVMSGSVSVFKEKDVYAFIFDYSKATWGKDMPLVVYFEEYPGGLTQCGHSFMESFSKETNGIELSEDGKTNFKIILHINKMDNTTGGALTGFAFLPRIWGTLDVVNETSNQILCSIRIKDFYGVSDHNHEEAFLKSFTKLAKEITKYINKQK